MTVSQWSNWESKKWPHGKVYVLDVRDDAVLFRNYAGSNGTMPVGVFMKKYKKIKGRKRANPPAAASNVRHIATRLDAFTKGYIEAMLWTSTDGDRDASLGNHFDQRDFSARAMSAIIRDCKQFQKDNAEDLLHGDDGRAGQDFWLTRNYHGAGFWDGDWPEDAGKRLTDDAHAYGESNVYVGDNGKLYLYEE